VIPWVNEEELRAFARTRTEEEGIILELLHQWSDMTAEMLEKKERKSGSR
jgi:hypothetical protein